MVTGASRGIGRAIAGRLADEGWDLLLSARGGQGLEEAVASLSDSGAAVRGMPADMGRPADIEALAAAQYERGSELDLLVYCQIMLHSQCRIRPFGGVVVWLAIRGPATRAVASVSRVRGDSTRQLIAAILMQNSSGSSGDCRIWLRAVSLQILVRAAPVIIWGRR